MKIKRKRACKRNSFITAIRIVEINSWCDKTQKGILNYLIQNWSRQNCQLYNSSFL